MSEMGLRKYQRVDVRAPREHGGLRLFEAGFDGRDIHLQMHPHWLRNHWGLVLLTDGLGFCESATMAWRELRPGDCVICVPTLWHNYGPQPGQWWEEYYLFFDGPLLDGLTAAGRMPRLQQVLRPGLGAPVVDCFRAAVDAAHAGDLARASEAAFAALARVLAAAEAPETAAPPTPLAGLAERLMADPARAWSFPALARELGLTYDGFRRAFRRHFDLSPGAWLHRERMHMACRLLLEDLPVGEVCRRVGMGDAFHFSRRFKAHFGASPRAYVRQLRGEAP
jgi:AraC-like DNA-binding protein